jgi:hypothetical protein
LILSGGIKTLICPTEHEFILYLPSKSNLMSKHAIQHYCRCRDQQDKVFPFHDCPDLKAFEVTVAPQSCSDQHVLFCPTNVNCPSKNIFCNCNCTYPNSLQPKAVCSECSNESLNNASSLEPNQSDQNAHTHRPQWDLDSISILILVVGAADCLMLFVVGLEIIVLIA